MDKNPPAVQETQEMRVRSLGGEDLLEEGMAAHSSILTWRIPWTEEPGGLLSPRGRKETRLKQLSTHAGTGNKVPHAAGQPSPQDITTESAATTGVAWAVQPRLDGAK